MEYLSCSALAACKKDAVVSGMAGDRSFKISIGRINALLPKVQLSIHR